MNRSRRRVLQGAGAALAVGLAGCSGGDGGDEPEDTEEQLQTETAAEEESSPEATQTADTVVDEEVTLNPNGHEAYRMYYDSRFTLSYEFEVIEGDPIDVFVVLHENMQQYESGGRFAREDELLDARQGSKEVELPSGTYYLIVDHTDQGEAAPRGSLQKDPVTVQVQATAEQNQ